MTAQLLHDCIVRDLKSADHYRTLYPDRQDETDPESAVFYELRAVGYMEDLEALNALLSHK